MKENLKGHIAAVSSNVIFGVNLSVTKSLLNSSWMTSGGFALIRLFFCSVMFWIIGFFTAREKMSRRDLLTAAAGGLFGPFISQATFAVGLRFTTPVTWALISALIPICILLLSIPLLNETISLKKTAGVIIGICGAVLVLVHNKSRAGAANSIFGIILALVSIIGYSLHIIVMRKVSLKYAPATVMKWMYLSGFILLAPFGMPELPKQRLFSAEAPLVPYLQLGFTLFFSSFLGYFLLPVALKRIKTTSASMYVNLQPLATATAAIIIGQDIFTWDKLAALVLIIIGVCIVTRSK